jgi:hypothetical protein
MKKFYSFQFFNKHISSAMITTRRGILTPKSLLPLMLIGLFYFILPQTSVAQFIWKLRNDDMVVKGLIKPLIPLPDSIKTYQIVSQIAYTTDFTGVDERMVNDVIVLNSLQKKADDADLIISVSIKKFTPSVGAVKNSTTDKGQISYWYEETLKPQIYVVLKDKSGRVLYSQSGGQATTYTSTKSQTKETAVQAQQNKGQNTQPRLPKPIITR